MVRRGRIRAVDHGAVDPARDVVHGRSRMTCAGTRSRRVRYACNRHGDTIWTMNAEVRAATLHQVEVVVDELAPGVDVAGQALRIVRAVAGNDVVADIARVRESVERN